MEGSANFTVDLFVPCILDQFYPELAFKVCEVLESCGFKVKYNKSQTCCGRFACENGELALAKKVTSKLLTDFANKQVVLSPCSDCLQYVQELSDPLFVGTVERTPYKRVSGRFYDAADYMVNSLGIKNIPSFFKGKLLFIDPPSANSDLQRIREATYSLLKNIQAVHIEWSKDVSVFQLLDFSVPKRLPDLVEDRLVQWFQANSRSNSKILVTSRSSVYMGLKEFLRQHEELSQWSLKHSFEIFGKGAYD